jgi:molybdenum cofactor synthesis domain-containing protein
MTLVAVEEVRAFVLARCGPLPPVEVPLAEALGAVAAAEVRAGEAVPGFDNSAMDGFAVRAADVAGAPTELRVVGTQLAGPLVPVSVGPGEAVRIMTGAAVPAGADAVVMIERTTPAADGASVVVEAAVEPGTAVRRAGDDLAAGDVVVTPGTVLTPGRLGVLANVGATSVVVHRRPRVGVLSTGDELVEGGGPLDPGQVRDSNRPTLLALVAASGFTPVDLGRVGDDEAAITAAVRSAVGPCDAVLTSGGVSMGDVDLVKVVLDRIGDMRWFQVAVKPAKPFAFGVVEGMPVFGLPGNPVSSMVSFELFARPALRRMAGFGDDDLDRPRVQAIAADDLRRRPDGKVHLVRVVARRDAEGRHHVRSAGGQGSHQLAAMAAADALAVLPDGDGVAAGDEVEVLLLS